MGKLTDINGSQWVHNSISWFKISTPKLTKVKKKHPATYPSELAKRFIEMLTKKGEWVIDPFLGTGSTSLAARSLCRNSIGIEITPEFFETANFCLGDETLIDDGKHVIIHGDSMDIDNVLRKNFEQVPSIKLVMSSPPYWNMLKKSRGGSDSRHKNRKKKGSKLTYSDLENDLGNVNDYDEFIEKLTSVFVKLKPFLHTEAHLVLVLQNIRNNDGKYYPLAWDIAYKLRERGFKLLQEQIWCQNDKKKGIWGFPSTYVTNTWHHYCIVLKNN